MKVGENISVEIDPGKILEIRLLTIGEPNEQGEVMVYFELNGQQRSIRVEDKKQTLITETKPKADSTDSRQVGAPMPGLVAAVRVEEGQEIAEGDLLLTMEAMKMETSIHAEVGGVIKRLCRYLEVVFVDHVSRAVGTNHFRLDTVSVQDSGDLPHARDMRGRGISEPTDRNLFGVIPGRTRQLIGDLQVIVKPVINVVQLLLFVDRKFTCVAQFDEVDSFDNSAVFDI